MCAFTDHEGLLDTTKIPENVLMFDRVPQLRMLQLADLFITHGGLGSIKESIMAGVPMLAYPITNNWDSNGNCTKIAFHEFGLKGNIDRDSALHIIAKIYRIFNTTSFRKSLLSINDLVVRVYTDKRFVEHIDKLLAD
ncbi:MAG: hypothetical protein Q8K64_07530 [Sediminibacterium sp.]|nr:hypothetical protein [Sediminibacterium sp.]